MTEWINSASTVALLAVTAWYATLTYRLVKSSESAATSARETARLANESLMLDQARNQTHFEVEFTPGAAFGARFEHLRGLRLSSNGTECVVHSIWVSRIASISAGAADWKDTGFALRFEPSDTSRPGFGAVSEYKLDVRTAVYPATRVDAAEVAILYSIPGTGPTRIRRVLVTRAE